MISTCLQKYDLVDLFLTLSILAVFCIQSNVVPLTPLQFRKPRIVFPSPVQFYANYAVSRFPVQTKTVQCNAI